MQLKLITSVAPAPAGMVMEAVVELLLDSPPIKIVGAVRSCAWQVHPFVAVNPDAPFMVITTVQLFAPRVKIPAVAPPVVELTAQPDVVNFVPIDCSPGRNRNPFSCTAKFGVASDPPDAACLIK